MKEEQGGFLSKVLKDRFSVDGLKKLGLNARQIEAVGYVKRNGKITNKNCQEINSISKKTSL